MTQPQGWLPQRATQPPPRSPSLSILPLSPQRIHTPPARSLRTSTPSNAPTLSTHTTITIPVMDETLVNIPGATAHHVLGQSSVTLGAGDLNLLPAPPGSRHDLMLTVGSAGFSLHHDTAFGTLEGDSRAYVFSPEIEGVKGGCVRFSQVSLSLHARANAWRTVRRAGGTGS